MAVAGGRRIEDRVVEWPSNPFEYRDHELKHRKKQAVWHEEHDAQYECVAYKRLYNLIKSKKLD